MKRDYYVYNEWNEDDSWDGIWDVATRITETGWYAEIRIPFRTLRFSASVAPDVTMTSSGRKWSFSCSRPANPATLDATARNAASRRAGTRRTPRSWHERQNGTDRKEPHPDARRPDPRSRARRHARQMATNNSVYHDGNMGNEITRWRRLAQNTGAGRNCKSLFRSFMQSPSHRTNIIGAWRFMAVGIEYRNGKIFTQHIFENRENPGNIYHWP